MQGPQFNLVRALDAICCNYALEESNKYLKKIIIILGVLKVIKKTVVQ